MATAALLRAAAAPTCWKRSGSQLISSRMICVNASNDSVADLYSREPITRRFERWRKCGCDWPEEQRTIFNLLGPLLNPARPKRQLIGVFSPHLTMLFADVLRRLDCERAWIVNGTAVDSLTLDDVSTIGPTVIAEVNSGKITSAVLDTRWLGIPQATLPELTGGDARTNAETIMRILAGGETGPKHDLVIANAAAGFVVSGLASEMNGGIAMAREQIESGRALEKLKALQNFVAS